MPHPELRAEPIEGSTVAALRALRSIRRGACRSSPSRPHEEGVGAKAAPSRTHHVPLVRAVSRAFGDASFPATAATAGVPVAWAMILARRAARWTSPTSTTEETSTTRLSSFGMVCTHHTWALCSSSPLQATPQNIAAGGRPLVR